MRIPIVLQISTMISLVFETFCVAAHSCLHTCWSGTEATAPLWPPALGLCAFSSFLTPRKQAGCSARAQIVCQRCATGNLQGSCMFEPVSRLSVDRAAALHVHLLSSSAFANRPTLCLSGHSGSMEHQYVPETLHSSIGTQMQCCQISLLGLQPLW